MPSASTTPRISAITASPVSLSSCPVGSSATSSRGDPASARAIATRCCWPPDSSSGRCRACAGEPDQVEQQLHPALALGDGRLAQAQRQADVLGSRQHRDQAERLEDERHLVAAQLVLPVLVQRGDVDAVDDHAALVRPVEAADEIEQRGLA